MRIRDGIGREVGRLSEGDDKARLVARIAQVHQRYRMVIEKVYRENAPMFLEHTNSVYITDKDGGKTLIVYMDESIFAAELNAQRELIRLYLQQMFAENIETFDIHVSRGKYKKRHPFTTQETADGEPALPFDKCRTALTPEQNEFIRNTLSTVDDAKMRQTLEKAMTADLKRQKKEK